LGTPPEPVWQAWLVWRRALVATRIAPFLKADPANRARIKPEALWEHDQAQRLGGNDLLEASTVRTMFYQHLLTLFERHDYLVLPTAQVWPFDAEEHWPSQIRGVAMDTYHRWMEVTIYATFAGLPCVAIPAGFGPQGLPMGLQIIGRPHDDRGVLRLARLWEQGAAELLTRRPPG
jgi:amidase